MAEKRGEALGIELEKVLKAAESAEDMAEQFQKANSIMGGTGKSTDGVFAARETRTGQSSPVEASWTSLRDLLQGFLGENYINLMETSRGLKHSVADFSDTDDKAGETLRTAASPKDGNPRLDPVDIPEPGDDYGYKRPDLPDGYQTTTKAEANEQARAEQEEDKRLWPRKCRPAPHHATAGTNSPARSGAWGWTSRKPRSPRALESTTTSSWNGWRRSTAVRDLRRYPAPSAPAGHTRTRR
ncbi:MAG: hypothetical protein ACRD0P_29655, partial [Stackebrandtia sp.]